MTKTYIVVFNDDKKAETEFEKALTENTSVAFWEKHMTLMKKPDLALVIVPEKLIPEGLK